MQNVVVIMVIFANERLKTRQAASGCGALRNPSDPILYKLFGGVIPDRLRGASLRPHNAHSSAPTVPFSIAAGSGSAKSQSQKRCCTDSVKQHTSTIT